MANHAVENVDPPSPPRRGRAWLAYACMICFAIALYDMAGLPGERPIVLIFLVAAGTVALAVLWFIRVLLSVVRRRVRNGTSLWVPPLLFVIGAVPHWSRVFAEHRLNKIGPDLAAFFETQKALNEGVRTTVPEPVAGLQIRAVTRHGTTFVAELLRSPDSEYGLIYSPDQKPPVRPSWVRHHSEWSIGQDWSEYSWSNDP